MSFDDFLGTWKLVSCELRRGNEVSYPFGEDPVGFIIYNSDGYMAAFLAPKERSHFKSDDIMGGSAEEKIAAMDTFVSYCGRFEVLSDIVVHHVAVSMFPNWRGEKRERFYKFEGNRLILSTAPNLISGKIRTARIAWEKV